MWDYLIIFSIILAASYVWYKKRIRHVERCLNKIPGIKTYTIFGDALRKFGTFKEKGILHLIGDLVEEYGGEGLRMFWVGPIPMVAVCSPQLIEEVCKNKYSQYKGPLFGIVLTQLKGIFTISGGAEWAKLRRPTDKALSKLIVERKFLPIFSKRVFEFTEYVKEKCYGRQFNIFRLIGLLNFDIFAETSLGLITNELRNPQLNFSQNCTIYLEGLWESMKSVHFGLFRVLNLPIGSKKSRQAYENCLSTAQYVLDLRHQFIARGKPDGDEPWFDSLLRIAMENKESKLECCKQATEMMTAGTDTTTATLSAALVFLALHPDVQESVYDEQVHIFHGDQTTAPTAKDFEKMQLLTRVIKETLRLISPFGLTKQAQADFQLGGHLIPKDVYLLIPVNHLHRSSQYWERPDHFHPDHFLPEAEAARPTFAYLPFGLGLRKCPGKAYAMSYMLTAVSIIIRRFKLISHLRFEDVQLEQKLLCELNRECYNIKMEERSPSK